MIQRIAVCSETLIELCKINNYFKLNGSLKINSNFLENDILLNILCKSKDLFIYNSIIFPKRVFLETYKILDKTIIIKLKNYNDIDSVKQFINSYIMIKEDFLLKYLKTIKHPLAYINYFILDKKLKSIGKVTNIIFTLQNRLVLDNNIELPFIDNFIISIDNVNKTIIMDLPEGIY